MFCAVAPRQRTSGTPWCGASPDPRTRVCRAQRSPLHSPCQTHADLVWIARREVVLAHQPDPAAAPAGVSEKWTSDTVFKDTACVVAHQIGTTPLPHHGSTVLNTDRRPRMPRGRVPPGPVRSRPAQVVPHRWSRTAEGAGPANRADPLGIVLCERVVSPDPARRRRGGWPRRSPGRRPGSRTRSSASSTSLPWPLPSPRP